jgi:hypothetical protein
MAEKYYDSLSVVFRISQNLCPPVRILCFETNSKMIVI